MPEHIILLIGHFVFQLVAVKFAIISLQVTTIAVTTFCVTKSYPSNVNYAGELLVKEPNVDKQ